MNLNISKCLRAFFLLMVVSTFSQAATVGEAIEEPDSKKEAAYIQSQSEELTYLSYTRRLRDSIMQGHSRQEAREFVSGKYGFCTLKVEASFWKDLATIITAVRYLVEGEETFEKFYLAENPHRREAAPEYFQFLSAVDAKAGSFIKGLPIRSSPWTKTIFRTVKTLRDNPPLINRPLPSPSLYSSLSSKNSPSFSFLNKVPEALLKYIMRWNDQDTSIHCSWVSREFYKVSREVLDLQKKAFLWTVDNNNIDEFTNAGWQRPKFNIRVVERHDSEYKSNVFLANIALVLKRYPEVHLLHILAESTVKTLSGSRALQLAQSSLTTFLLQMVDIPSLADFADFSHLKVLKFNACNGFTNLQGLSCPLLTIFLLYASDITNVAGLEAPSLTICSLKSSSSLSNIEGLSRCSKLEALDLSGAVIVNVDALAGLPLRAVNLSGCKSLINLGGLSGVKTLATLDVSSTGITSLKGINWGSLTALNLNNCLSLSNTQDLSGAQSLEVLEARNVNIQFDFVLPSLRSLVLANSHLRDDLVVLKDYLKLISLSLEINSEIIPDLSILTTYPALTELSLMLEAPGLLGLRVHGRETNEVTMRRVLNLADSTFKIEVSNSSSFNVFKNDKALSTIFR